jgi:integrase
VYFHAYWTSVGHDDFRSWEGDNMARKVKDKALDSREARGKLPARGKPFYRSIERGLHLGYRRLKGRAGTWWARHYIGKQAYTVESIGAADDLSDADGVAILSYWQAQTKAREMMVSRAHAAVGKTGPLTVSEIMEGRLGPDDKPDFVGYLEFLETNRKTGSEARYRYEAFIKPTLGNIEVNALTTDQISAWLLALAKKAPRLRTAKGKPQRHAELGKDDQAERRRKATANRTLTILKAALNRAWRTKRKLVPSDAEWRAVEPFKKVDKSRVEYLTVAKAQRLINASEPDFRRLVQAALQTGCRYGELTRLKVEDFDDDVGTLAINVTKSGQTRHVNLTDEGIKFFRQLCAGREGDQLMLTHEDGSAWGKSHQGVPMRQACARAKIKPPINFHGLRHTWASLAVMAGVPLLIVARNLGHADTKMCEKHYAHMAPGHVRDEIMRGAPRFGIAPLTNVRPIR